MAEEVGKRVVPIHAQGAGATADTRLDLVVDRTTLAHYRIGKGYKLRVFDVETAGEGETEAMIKIGTTDVYADAVKTRSYKLASKGHLHVRYSMPYIVEAIEGDLYFFVGYIQPTAVAMRANINAELVKLIG